MLKTERTAKITRIAACPRALHDAVEGLSDEQLDTPYRDGGWTVRQVIHHVADSHMALDRQGTGLTITRMKEHSP